MQDGGVRANNPLSIALKESVIIWPAAGRHDLLISVGTGSSVSNCRSNGSSAGNIFKDGAVPRLFRAAMSSPSMDGEQGFYEALNYIPDHMRGDIYRLNHAMTCPLPALDDVEKLAELEGLTYSVPDDLVRAVLVTGSFFFEIDQTPISKNGSYFCEGSVLCRSPKARDLLKRVAAEFPGGEYQTARGHSLGLIDEDDGCCECGYYRKKVAFHVKSLEEMIAIEIATSSSRRKIGGFPRSVQDLLNDQQAFARFGRPDHLLSTWPPRRACFCLRGSKRAVQFLEPNLSKKPRRL